MMKIAVTARTMAMIAVTLTPNALLARTLNVLTWLFWSTAVALIEPVLAARAARLVEWWFDIEPVRGAA
jgi:hypothetical protein